MLLIWPLVVCVAIYFSFIGWGYLISYFDDRSDFAMAGAYGMAVACVVGGVLNLFELISYAAIGIFLGAGLVLWVVTLVSRRTQIRRISCVVMSLSPFQGLVGLAILVLLGITLVYGTLPFQNPHDDNHAYLVFPTQMLQSGAINPDPFNERRMGVLGAQAFLNATLLAFVAPSQVASLDAVLGWVAFFMLVLTHTSRAVGPSSWPMVVIPGVVLLHEPHVVNISSHLTSLVLFYALLRHAGTAPGRSVLFTRSGFALIAAALCSLKTTNIVGLSVMTITVLLCLPPGLLARRFADAAWIVAVTLALMMPWMIAMYQSSGTLLFPILGDGVHTAWIDGAAHLSVRQTDLTWNYLQPILVTILTLPHIGAGLVVIVLLKACKAQLASSPVARPAFIGSLVASVLLAIVSLALFRYSYPFGFSAFVYLVVETFDSHGRAGERRLRSSKSMAAIRTIPGWVGVVCFSVLLCIQNPGAITERIFSIGRFSFEDNDSLPKSMSFSVRRAQQNTRPGSSIVARLSHPYLLDFERNRIYIIDHPGSAGPGRGLPVRRSPESLVRYLRDNGVDFIMYSYSDEAGFSRQNYGDRLDARGSPYGDRVRILAENSFGFHAQILELAKRKAIVYVDEFLVLIDLKLIAENL